MIKLRELEKRLRDEPENLGLRVALAGELHEAGRRDDAVELYRSVAIAYRAQGRAQQAITVCRSVLEMAPDDVSSQALLAAMLAERAPAVGEGAPAAGEGAPVAGDGVPAGAPPVERPRGKTKPPPPPRPAAKLRPPTAKPVHEPPPLAPPEPEAGDGVPQRLSSSNDITPLPAPLPHHIAEPTIPPMPHAAPGRAIKLSPADLPPSMRRELTGQLARELASELASQAGETPNPSDAGRETVNDLDDVIRPRLEGIANAARQISASLLAADAAAESGASTVDAREATRDSAAEATIDRGPARGRVAALAATPLAGVTTLAGDDDDDDDDDAPAEDDAADGESDDAADDAAAEDEDDETVDAEDLVEVTEAEAVSDVVEPDTRKRPRVALNRISRLSITKVVRAVDDEKTEPRELPHRRPSTAHPMNSTLAPGGPGGELDPLESPLLAPIPRPNRVAVLQRFRRRLAGVGTTVIRRGETGHGLVFVIRGRLDVHCERADGARVSLEAIEPGDYVGEISLLARVPAAAYVVAAIDCELLVLPAADFYEISGSFPALRSELRTSAEQRTRVYEQRLRV